MAEMRNFTPLVDSLVKVYGPAAAAVWGRIWRYEQMPGGKCTASKETLAEGLRISVRTAQRHIDKLIKDGYLEDLTPNQRNKPHELITTAKARIEFIVEAVDDGMPKSHTSGMSKCHSHYDKMSDEESIKKQNKKNLLPPAPKKKSRDERLDHPAMVAYNEIMRLWPAHSVRDKVCAIDDADRWAEVLIEWAERGYNPRNIKGILEVYENGFGKGRDNPERAPRGF